MYAECRSPDAEMGSGDREAGGRGITRTQRPLAGPPSQPEVEDETENEEEDETTFTLP